MGAAETDKEEALAGADTIFLEEAKAARPRTIQPTIQKPPLRCILRIGIKAAREAKAPKEAKEKRRVPKAQKAKGCVTFSQKQAVAPDPTVGSDTPVEGPR